MKHTIPFAIVPSSRDYSRNKDSLLLNCFIERQGENVTVVKRPGFNKVGTVSASLGTDTGTRGAIYVPSHDKYYLVIKDAVYSISADFLTITDISPAVAIATTTGKVYFDVIFDTVPVVVLNIPTISGTTSQVYKIVNATPSVTTAITTNVPTSIVGSGITFNNYYYVVNNNSANLDNRIYNCSLNDIDTWSTTNYLVANEFPDGAVGLAKLNNRLVCLKENSIEFFYDAGNATGSPLVKVANETLNIGCGSAESIVTVDNILIWMSKDFNSGLAIHALMGGQLQKISTGPIDKVLASVEGIITQHKVSSFFISYQGHKLYGLTIDGDVIGGITAIPNLAIPNQAIPNSAISTSSFKRTIVYDLTEQLWHEWSSNDGSDNQISFFCNVFLTGRGSSVNDYTNTLAVNKTTGDFYTMSPEPIGTTTAPVYKDYDKFIRSELVTNLFDGGIQDRKRGNSLEILGDRETGSTISVYYSDDDYQTWVGPKTVDMSTRSRIRQLGSFEQRAFKFIHESNTPMRIRGFELDIEKGSI